MRRTAAIFIASAAPGPALAHDAFGDLGPFYANLLHPLADPLQAALLIGSAAFVAGRPLGIVRLALPVYIATAALAHLILVWGIEVVSPPVLMAVVAVAVGGAAMLPLKWTRLPVALALVSVAGSFTGIAPDRPPVYGALQPLVGTVLGIAMLTTLAWTALDLAARKISPLAPAIVGSWVAAVGLLIAAFAMQPVQETASTKSGMSDASETAGSEQ